MYTDLICFDSKENFGFSKVIKIELIRASSAKELEKKIQRFRQEITIVEGSDLNRLIVENKYVDILVSPEKNRREDFMHHRNSGLNQVLCKLAFKNSIAIAFSFNDVLKAKGIERSKIIGRMMQNVRLCRKYKVKMITASFAANEFEIKNPSDLISFGIVIGMAPKEAKEALMNVDIVLKEKENKKSGGVRIIGV